MKVKETDVLIDQWEFKFSWEEYEKRFIEEKRLNILREECEALEIEQNYIESAASISRKYLTTPFSC